MVKTSLDLAKGHPNHPSRVMYHNHMRSMLRYQTVGYGAYRELMPEYVNLAAQKSLFSYTYWLASLGLCDAPSLDDPLYGEIAHCNLALDLGITEAFAPREGDVSRIDGEPWAIGHPAFHLSHQFNLLRKRPDVYAPMFHARSWTELEMRQGRGYLIHVWGDELHPLVEADAEPYLWPVTTEAGVELFQVGTQSDRARYAHLYDADPSLRMPLYVTPEEALERIERHHPAVLASYLRRVERYEEDEAYERSVEAGNWPALSTANQPIPWPSDLPDVDTIIATWRYERDAYRHPTSNRTWWVPE